MCPSQTLSLEPFSGLPKRQCALTPSPLKPCNSYRRHGPSLKVHKNGDISAAPGRGLSTVLSPPSTLFQLSPPWRLEQTGAKPKARQGNGLRSLLPSPRDRPRRLESGKDVGSRLSDGRSFVGGREKKVQLRVVTTLRTKQEAMCTTNTQISTCEASNRLLAKSMEGQSRECNSYKDKRPQKEGQRPQQRRPLWQP